jgi:hypothetical protein
MRIDSAGNVGIGTSSPTAKLDTVFSTGGVGPRFRNTTALATNEYSQVVLSVGTAEPFTAGANNRTYQVQNICTSATASDFRIQYYNGSTDSYAERMRIDSSGNVGIGTASPTSKLDVIQDQNATSRLRIRNNDSGSSAYAGVVVNASGNSWEMRMGSSAANSNALQFVLDALGTPSVKATIDSSGNLLVGGTAYFGAGLSLGSPASSGCASIFAAGGTGNHFRFGNVTNGIVGAISTTTSATTYSTSSDYRLKNTIAPMTGALEKVALLKPCTYKWNTDGSDGEGFIAHELQAVVPQCVTGEKDAVDTDGKPVYQGIDTSFLVATLTAAIQELKALVDTQASTITTLTDRITVLESK